MKLTVTIEDITFTELSHIEAALAGTKAVKVEKPAAKKTADKTADKPETAAAKRKRLAAEKKAAAAAKKETPAQKRKRLAAEKKAKEEAELLEEGPTKADVHAAMKAFIQANSVPAAKEVMAEYGAGKLSELDEEHFEAIIEDFAVE